MDPITETRIKLLHPKLRDEVTSLVNKVSQAGINIRIVQGFRTFDDQNKLYSQGRTQAQLDAVGLKGVVAQPTLPVVTNAMAWQSWHCWGLAIDFCLLHQDKSISWSQVEDSNNNGTADWLEVIKIFGEAGYESGLYWKFKDAPHLQKTFGLSLQQALALKDKGFLDSEGFIII